MTKQNTNPKVPHLLRLIEEKRAKSGITPYRIAKETGHSQQQLGKILKGEHNPRLGTVIDILDQLGLEFKITKASKL